MANDTNNLFKNSYFLLLDNNVAIDRKKLLPLIAEFIEIKGNVTQIDNLLFLDAPIKMYKRLGK